MTTPLIRTSDNLFERELKLRARAGQVMSELKSAGSDWQEAWRTHPVAIAYRALLKEAWEGTPVDKGTAVDAVDPHASDPGKPTTRDKEGTH